MAEHMLLKHVKLSKLKIARNKLGEMHLELLSYKINLEFYKLVDKLGVCLLILVFA